ncbi:MAG: DUF3164 family protein [Vicingaceae bacterium]|nr:DUF3164 family protein [Vicingaceae bacterium]
MKILEINAQRSSDKMWKDEKGIEIPFSRTTKSERMMETQSFKILKKALQLNERLNAFKQEIKEICEKVYATYMEEQQNEKPSKGNFTWYNFDRSIKIEVSINERIEFDDMAITACKDKLNQFLTDNVESKDAFIKEMVLDAFETSRGKLDAKKVMSLLRYRSKIKATLFQEALNLLESSIRRPDSKMYFRVWHRNDDGKYENVELNFSSI